MKTKTATITFNDETKQGDIDFFLEQVINLIIDHQITALVQYDPAYEIECEEECEDGQA